MSSSSPPPSDPPLLRPAVLGGVDGIITTLAVLWGGMRTESVVRIATATLVADALSMGVSEFLSSREEGKAKEAATRGGVCLLSFATFGGVPILFYEVGKKTDTLLLPTGLVGASYLLLLGGVRSYLRGGRVEGVVRSAAETLLLGAGAVAAAYGIGEAFG